MEPFASPASTADCGMCFFMFFSETRITAGWPILRIASARTLRLPVSLMKRFAVFGSTIRPKPTEASTNFGQTPKPFSSGEVHGPSWIQPMRQVPAPMRIASRQASEVVPG